MKVFLLSIVFPAILFLVSTSFAESFSPPTNRVTTYCQDADSVLYKKIDSLVISYLRNNTIPGISIGITKNKKIYYTHGYGFADIKKNVPVVPLTNFETGSVSKLFTSTAIMQLVEQGKIDITNKLVFYLPEFKMTDLRYRDITIAQMLTHTSGLPDVKNYNWGNADSDSLALKNYVLKPAFNTLLFAPGSDQRYSNWAFDILGYVVEKITGENFEEYVFNHILSVTGMVNSSFDYSKIPLVRRSLPYSSTIFKKYKPCNTYPYSKEHAPCGMLNSCAVDLSEWMIEIQNIYDDTSNTYKGVINHATLTKMWTTKPSDLAPNLFNGLTWWKKESEQYGNYYFHNGTVPGFCASLTIWPENKIGIVVLCNTNAENIAWSKIPFEIEQLVIK
ncbi:N/A [soil metagenome]